MSRRKPRLGKKELKNTLENQEISARYRYIYRYIPNRVYDSFARKSLLTFHEREGPY